MKVFTYAPRKTTKSCLIAGSKSRFQKLAQRYFDFDLDGGHVSFHYRDVQGNEGSRVWTLLIVDNSSYARLVIAEHNQQITPIFVRKYQHKNMGAINKTIRGLSSYRSFTVEAMLRKSVRIRRRLAELNPLYSTIPISGLNNDQEKGAPLLSAP